MRSLSVLLAAAVLVLTTAGGGLNLTAPIEGKWRYDLPQSDKGPGVRVSIVFVLETSESGAVQGTRTYVAALSEVFPHREDLSRSVRVGGTYTPPNVKLSVYDDDGEVVTTYTGTVSATGAVLVLRENGGTPIEFERIE
jgi:hypothetical protein